MSIDSNFLHMIITQLNLAQLVVICAMFWKFKSHMDSKFDRIESKFDKIETRLTSIECRISHLEGAFHARDCCVLKVQDQRRVNDV